MFKTLIVLDGELELPADKAVTAISFQDYLHQYPKLNEPKTRIINLCDTETYLSKGYYCSLLAEARDHQVLPSVKTINGLRAGDEGDVSAQFKGELAALGTLAATQHHLVCFGRTTAEPLRKLARKVFQQFPAPVLKLTLEPAGSAMRLRVSCHSYSSLEGEEREQFLADLWEFMQNSWRIGGKRKRLRWDMAILVNSQEKVPPSSREAISRFVKAAEKHGINAEPLEISQIENIAYYDALFIRETTAIDHHTYRLASKAEQKGLVVIDDPVSILRCCNKVYLHDAFSYQKVPSLKTLVVDDAGEQSVELLEQAFGYPLVLKMPEGSFSRGVFKVKDRGQLVDKLQELLQQSALVLAQEYLFTDYDWRIGVLNGRAIYACRYLMARNHWQIYNHDSKRFSSGGFETLPTFEVPKCVLDAALKAARIIGDGLYGVDVKELDGKAYVLEVNDNPSIDYKVEDAYLGNELYMQIMAEFQRRLEARGR